MPKRKIVITRNDYEYLKELLSSEFTQAISPSDFLESLEAELELAEVVDPERVPKNVVTMNSTVKLRDLDTNEVETYTLVFPEEADIANLQAFGTCSRRNGDLGATCWRRASMACARWMAPSEGRACALSARARGCISRLA